MRIKLIQPKMLMRPMDTGLKLHMAPPLGLYTAAQILRYDHEVTVENGSAYTEDTILSAGGDNYGIHIPKGVWHWVEILESGTVTFEVKEGPYEPLKEEDIMK